MFRADSPDERCTAVVAEDGRIRCDGVEIECLTEAIPPAFRVPNQYEPSQPDRSDRVRLNLERLAVSQPLARIEFAARGGLGFRAIQAKRAGLAFENVSLAVRLDGCSRWDRERAERWPNGIAELERDHMERYAFEHADERITAVPALADFVQRLGWRPRPFAPSPVAAPLVTVGIAHRNLGEFLPATLASLAAQTYPHIEVIAIDDGSTDPHSLAVFEKMRDCYPQWRFLAQANAGIGATRNRCLELARGEFFLPVDADNIARPEMIERLVRAMQRNPHLAAMGCYFLAFASDAPGEFLFANRPTGGPLALAALRNVYGDANAIIRTAALRAVGGYETDRGTSCEDWEAFVKLVRAGGEIGVVPDHLFEYRFRPGGFSRSTNWFANHGRVMRQFARGGPLSADDAEAVWSALLGFHQRIQHLESGAKPRRYRIADRVASAVRSVPRLWRRRGT